MKSDSTSRKFPADPREWEALIADIPGDERPARPEEEAAWANGVVVKAGGHAAVRAALAKRREEAGRAPKKILLSVGYGPEVVNYFKATGEGWQARMDTALKEWIEAHPLS